MYEYERDPGELPSEAAYTAVAAVTGTDPLDLPPMANAVDPGALDGLLDSGTQDTVRCEFEYADCSVELTGDRVLVSLPDAAD